jgi:hypothetical protein
VAVFADDDVIAHRDSEQSCDIDDRFGDLDIGLRWRRLRTWIIAVADNSGALLTKFAQLDRGIVDGANLLIS